MNEPGHYPPPDFSCPPPNFIQPFQQQPRSSSFHPSMWNWGETSSEPSWVYSGQADWHRGAATGFGYPSGHANHERPYRNDFGHDWQQGGRQNYGPSGHQGKKQKNKKDPEFSHFCDTCDRGFKNQEKYDEHVSQHVKCSVPDCSFKAHEKIVSIHWKNNHAPGAKRIKLDTPDEIARWREERRKNYPTLQNIEKKKKMMEVREETGSVLETAQFGRMRGRGRGRGWGRGRGRGRGWGNRGVHEKHSTRPLNDDVPERPPPLSRPSRDGDPLGALASGDQDSDFEDPAAESKTGVLVVAPKQMSSALGSLVANYGSMSESDEEPESTPIQKAKHLVQEKQALLNTIPAICQDRGMKTCSQRTDMNKVPQRDSAPYTPNSRRGRGGREGRGGRHQNMPQNRRPTLLEMLLAPDIRHERNVLLQCVRYVVRNNFFGLESRGQHQEKVRATSAASTGNGERISAQSGAAIQEIVKKEDLCPSKAAEVDQRMSQTRQDQGLLTGQVCSEQFKDPPVDSAASAEKVEVDLIKNATEAAARDADEVTSTFNVYDDEIWESPGGLV